MLYITISILFIINIFPISSLIHDIYYLYIVPYIPSWFTSSLHSLHLFLLDAYQSFSQWIDPSSTDIFHILQHIHHTESTLSTVMDPEVHSIQFSRYFTQMLWNFNSFCKILLQSCYNILNFFNLLTNELSSSSPELVSNISTMFIHYYHQHPVETVIAILFLVSIILISIFGFISLLRVSKKSIINFLIKMDDIDEKKMISYKIRLRNRQL